MTAEKNIEMKIISNDRRFGLMVELFDGEVNINVELVKEGLAKVRRGTLNKEYEGAEVEAMKGTIGIWSSGDLSD